MILNPEWLKPKEKPYFHQISMDCLEKLVGCIGRFNKGEIDADTSCQIEKQILTDEIQDTELLNFAVKNISTMGSVRREVPNGMLPLLDVGQRCVK
jgi:hypothetical protein